MKKILIALPLVLIMILSMIPVFAEEEAKTTNLELNWKVYTDYEVYNKETTKTPDNMTTIKDVKVSDVETTEKVEALAIAEMKKKFDEKDYVIKAMDGQTTVKGEEGTNAKAFIAVIGRTVAVPTTTAKDACPKLCKEIKIRALDIISNKVVEEKVYGVNDKVNPNYLNIVKHFKVNFLPNNEYQILSNWAGQPSVDLPSVIDSDCTITIKVLPRFVHVNVIHRLFNCCKEIDGHVNFTLWKSFVEDNLAVDFIAYHSQLIVDQTKAAEFAMTRLQKINAMDFVFIKAVFDDGIRLDQYMTGEVFDMKGNKITTITNKLPSIELIYHRAECVEKEEEKVDNATVENNNTTTAPATANGGANLPATGAKDVSAFFLSAVALLGLGIFFAKKH